MTTHRRLTAYVLGLAAALIGTGFMLGGCPGGDASGGPPAAPTAVAGETFEVASVEEGGSGPAAVAVNTATIANRAVSVRLRGEGSALSFEIVDPPSQGELGSVLQVDDSSADVIYTPSKDFVGAVQFSYRALQNGVAGAPAIVRVEVLPEIVFSVDTHRGPAPLSVKLRAFTRQGAPLPAGLYSWRIGEEKKEGQVGSHGELVHQFQNPGLYFIALTVTVASMSQPIACLQAEDSSPQARVEVLNSQKTIRGMIRDANGGPLTGVSVVSSDGAYSAVSSASGEYVLVVPSNANGSFAPSFAGAAFSPPSRPFTPFGADLPAQDFQMAPTGPDSSLGLTVSPADGLTASGPAGGPFAPASKTYTLQNAGTAAVQWSVAASESWLSVSPSGGSLNPGESIAVTVAFGAGAAVLAPGQRQANVNFTNHSGTGSTSRPVTLTITADPASLDVSPSEGFTSSGTIGGPFSPASKTYTLTNLGDEILDWAAAESEAWLTLSPATGQLLPGASTTITVAFDASASSLASGQYAGDISFVNITNGDGDTIRGAALSVNPPGVVTISGRITTSAGVSVSGVTLNGLPGNPQTNASGDFTAQVSTPWSGTITPSKTGYTFSPTSRTYTNVVADQTTQNFTAASALLTISGRILDGGGVGVSGVTLSGLPGNPTTNAGGDYSATVTWSWSGTVTPGKAGYTFAPTSRTYTNVTANQAGQNYTASGVTLTISGRILDLSNNPIAGVTLGGLPGNPQTDASGSYAATVPYGWTGAATPSKTGYSFSPVTRNYSNVTSDRLNQDYGASLLTYTISGRITDSGGAGVSGVTLTGLPNHPQTDANGDYAATVTYGWSGTATPTKTGYTFSPTSRTYANIAANQVNQHYTATLIGYLVSGRVTDGGGAGVAGVTLNGLPNTPTTNSNGDYSDSVLHGWDGTVTPSKVGYSFTPATRNYSNVTSNKTAQHFSAALLSYSISGRVTDDSGIPLDGVMLSGLPGDPSTDPNGNYTATAQHGWSGTATPTKTGYTFAPTTRTYAALSGPQASQDYVGTSTSGPAMASSISQYGITWTFDKPYRVGQFVTGDWWVIPDDPNGTVIVQSVSPAPTGSGSTYRNGSMVNPSAAIGNQAFRGDTYKFDQTLAASFPLAISAEKSLLSSISVAPEDGLPSWAFIRRIAVLTCLGDVPPADAFRPHYVYGPKTLYRVATLDIGVIPSVAATSGAPTLATYEAIFAMPQIDYFRGWEASTLHPYDNFPGTTYGRELSNAVGHAGLLLACDSATVGSKDVLLRRLVQVGIDNYGVLANGGVWNMAGGHPMGRKLPILLAGLLLNEPGMLSIGSDYLPQTCVFGEDMQYEYITQTIINTVQKSDFSGTLAGATATTVTIDRNAMDDLTEHRITITGGTGAGQTRLFTDFDYGQKVGTVDSQWTTTPDATSTFQITGYEARHLGLAEWGSEGYQTSWVGACVSPKARYRGVVSPFVVGSALAARIWGLQDEWNHAAYFDYVDRWVDTGFHSQCSCGRTGSNWMSAMWDLHR